MSLLPKASNADELISLSVNYFLYDDLVKQIEKDFALANESLVFSKEMPPIEIKHTIENKIAYLIQHQFSNYLNLLYIIDVSEDEIKNILPEDWNNLPEIVTYYILKREWKKVWFKKNYSF